MQIRSCEDKLKGKTAHFRLPSASQKRARLSSLLSFLYLYHILPQQSLYFLLVVVFVHDVHIQLNIWLSIQCMFREVTALKEGVHVQTLGPKMIGARDVRYNALAVLSLIRAPHPHVPVREVLGSRPLFFQLVFVQSSLQNP